MLNYDNAFLTLRDADYYDIFMFAFVAWANHTLKHNFFVRKHNQSLLQTASFSVKKISYSLILDLKMSSTFMDLINLFINVQLSNKITISHLAN